MGTYRWHPVLCPALPGADHGGGDIAHGGRGEFADWKIILEAWGADPNLSEQRFYEGIARDDLGKKLICMEVTRLLDYGWVKPVMRWQTGKPTPYMVPVAGHFATLALQLAHALTKAEFSAVCSYRKRPYLPTRKPAPGRNQYCKTCGTARAKLDYKKRRRAQLAVQRLQAMDHGNEQGEKERNAGTHSETE